MATVKLHKRQAHKPRRSAFEKPLPPGLRGQFCRRWRAIVRQRGVAAVVAATGLSRPMVYAMCDGRIMPAIERWPDLARQLGLAHWMDFFDRQPATAEAAELARENEQLRQKLAAIQADLALLQQRIA